MSTISQSNSSTLDSYRTLILFKSIDNATNSLIDFLNNLNESTQTDIKGLIVGDNSLFTNFTTPSSSTKT